MINLLKKAVRKEAIKRNKAIVDYTPDNLNKDFIKVFKLITKIKKEIDYPMPYYDGMNVYFLALNSKKVLGNIAVFGIYTGGTSKLICEAIGGSRKVYLFDTFEGHPKLSEEDNKNGLFNGENPFWEGRFAVDVKKVKNYLKSYKGLTICKGIFPKDTLNIIKDEKFCFVHIDLNLYVSTKETLEFMYPRMNKGGIMLFDDYFFIKGVRKSVSEFFRDKPETIIYSNNNQVMVVKQ